jgi:hypothetical protein
MNKRSLVHGEPNQFTHPTPAVQHPIQSVTLWQPPEKTTRQLPIEQFHFSAAARGRTIAAVSPPNGVVRIRHVRMAADIQMATSLAFQVGNRVLRSAKQVVEAVTL